MEENGVVSRSQKTTALETVPPSRKIGMWDWAKDSPRMTSYAWRAVLPCGCSPSGPCSRAQAILASRLSWADARGGIRAHCVAGLRSARVKRSKARQYSIDPLERRRCRERAKTIAQALAETRLRIAEIQHLTK